MCEYCEKEISLKKQISEIIKNENYEIRNVIDLSGIRKDLNDKALTVKRELENPVGISSTRLEELEDRLLSLQKSLEILREY